MTLRHDKMTEQPSLASGILLDVSWTTQANQNEMICAELHWSIEGRTWMAFQLLVTLELKFNVDGMEVTQAFNSGRSFYPVWLWLGFMVCIPLKWAELWLYSRSVLIEWIGCRWIVMVWQLFQNESYSMPCQAIQNTGCHESYPKSSLRDN